MKGCPKDGRKTEVKECFHDTSFSNDPAPLKISNRKLSVPNSCSESSSPRSRSSESGLLWSSCCHSGRMLVGACGGQHCWCCASLRLTVLLLEGCPSALLCARLACNHPLPLGVDVILTCLYLPGCFSPVAALWPQVSRVFSSRLMRPNYLHHLMCCAWEVSPGLGKIMLKRFWRIKKLQIFP